MLDSFDGGRHLCTKGTPVLSQLQQYLRTSASQGRTTSRVGPFLVTIDEGTNHPFLNYAVPDDAARPSAEEVTAMVQAFVARGRIPRLEYLEPAAPLVLAALEAQGFALEARVKAMTAARAADVPLAEGHAFLVPETDADRTAMLTLQNVAYGAPPEVDAAQLARSRALEAAGGIILAIRATVDGAIVAGGVTTAADGSGFTEVTGIAVAADRRRRRLATALTSELPRRAFAAGVATAFITPGDDRAARVYERAGFREIGQMLHVRKE